MPSARRFLMGRSMKPDAIKRLRQVMRAGNNQSTVGTVGTSEPEPGFADSSSNVPTKVPRGIEEKHHEFNHVQQFQPYQHKISEVESLASNAAVSASERPLERNTAPRTSRREAVILRVAFEADSDSQRKADLRNRTAVASHQTDRWCGCGSMATLAIFDPRRREGRWFCEDCFNDVANRPISMPWPREVEESYER
jgi:hypothetical protein